MPDIKIKRKAAFLFFKSTLISFVFFLSVTAEAFCQDEIKPGDILDLDQCIKIALENHPSMHAAAANLNASKSRIGQAKSSYYPQISANADYIKTRQPSTGYLEDTGPVGTYEGFVSLNQMLYDFGKTSSQVKINRSQADSSNSTLKNTASDVVLNVKQAYYNLLQMRDTRNVNKETVREFAQHLEMAKKLFETGIKPKIDVTKAEVDLSQAKLNLIKSENDLKVARITLANTMGIDDLMGIDIKDVQTAEDYNISYNDALEKAYNNRPDLTAQEAQYEAVKSSVQLAKTGNYPTFNGSAGYGKTGNNFPLNSEWNVGVSLAFPIFSGFNVKYQIDEANANLSAQKYGIDLMKQNIRLDVQKALINLTEIKNALGVSELSVRQAKENRELADGRYAEGIGNAIEVSDALVSELNAKTSYTIVQYTYHQAIARLEKAMGVSQ